MCNISELYIQRGFKIGYEKGVRKSKIECMVSMFDHDIPIETIANVSHLSVEETQKLIEENKSSFSTNPTNL